MKKSAKRTAQRGKAAQTAVIEKGSSNDHASAVAGGEFLNRDLSWLEFNRRVLHEALDPRTPLLDRMFFLGIFTSNLDEFFMKRVGLMVRRMGSGNSLFHANGESHASGLEIVHSVVQPMLIQQAECYQNEILPALNEAGIHLLEWSQLTDGERETVNRYFRDNVFPVLTPQAVDPSHPFPFMSNLSTSLALAISYPQSDERLFARVKVPKSLPQWIELDHDRSPGQRRMIGLRDMIQHNLHLLFPGMEIHDALLLRITRSASIDPDGEPVEDLLESVAEELRQRRLQKVIRLEHGSNPDPWLLDMTLKQLDVKTSQIYELPAELDFTDLKTIYNLDYPQLKLPPWTPVVVGGLASDDADIFSLIRAGDLLVHHPYESFDASVLRFVRDAVADENVLAIKMTVYRTSDDSPFVPLLIQAAEKGKQVACLVELKARFDESRNIRWANALEDAGVHVVYGVLGVKTHCKICTVVRREAGGLRTYAHIGTGNYNPQTAKLYTDLGLFTCDREITEDVVALFHDLTGRAYRRKYRRLLVAPVDMKKRFLALIEREAELHQAGRPARIIAKMNQLQDPAVGRALYAASQVGVPIDLIIRGFCTLRPGLDGLSPTIRVISVIGHFLEHSRIFYFQNGAEDPVDGEFYIGSADWMYRNLEERVEAVTPVSERSSRQKLWEILEVMLEDQRRAWVMQPDGKYVQLTPAEDASDVAKSGTHQTLMRRATRGKGLDYSPVD